MLLSLTQLVVIFPNKRLFWYQTCCYNELAFPHSSNMTYLSELIGLKVLKLLGKNHCRIQITNIIIINFHLSALIIANCSIGIECEDCFRTIWYLRFNLFSTSLHRQYEIHWKAVHFFLHISIWMANQKHLNILRRYYLYTEKLLRG